MATASDSPQFRVTLFSARDYDESAFDHATAHLNIVWKFVPAPLDETTAELAHNSDVVCLFVNDKCSAAEIERFKRYGVKLIALRSAGFDHVDLDAAKEAGIPVTHVPAYSPHAVAEHAVALMLSLNRKTHRAYIRNHFGNFALNSGLLGFDMNGKTAGIIGTGKIGRICAQILKGFGMTLLFHDLRQHPDMLEIGEYLPLDELCRRSDIISIHCPLTSSTKHMINDETINHMKPNVMLINTSRGSLIHTEALIRGIRSGKIGSVGLDVYENERGIFFENREHTIIHDDTFTRLLSFHNVLITGHQAFFTSEALQNIAASVIQTLEEFARGQALTNEIKHT